MIYLFLRCIMHNIGYSVELKGWLKSQIEMLFWVNSPSKAYYLSIWNYQKYTWSTDWQMSVKGIRIFLLLAKDMHKFYQCDQIKVYINTNKLNLWNFENESCIKIPQLRTTLISNSYICIILVNNKNFWQVGKDKWSLQSNTHTLTAYSLRTLGILSSNVKL